MTKIKPNAVGKPLRVAVLTPLGLGGKGGIDRLMDQINRVITGRFSDEVEVSYYKTRGEGSLASSAALTLKATLALLRRKSSRRIDLAHINLAHSGSVHRKIFLARICRALAIPYVVHLHGSRFKQTWEGASPRLSRELAGLFDHAAFTLVLGQYWADYLLGKVPGIRDRLALFPTAARDHGGRQIARPDGAPLNILFSGRLGERKGSRQLVEALGRIASEPGWRVDMTGDGEIGQTRSAVRALALEDRVSVPGWVSDETHAALVERAEMLVLPSFDENLPLSVVEAFARGIAVVATPVGAVGEIVKDGETGLIVEPGDVDGLSHAILRLLRDADLRHTLGANARRVFEERLDVEIYTERLISIWAQAASGGDEVSERLAEGQSFVAEGNRI